jgi:prevent-host-death family protein
MTVTATQAKNQFGPLLEAAMQGGAVVITKHDAPKAVLLSMAEYQALGGAMPPDLDALTSEFDARFGKLQSPAGRRALKAAFAATPAELGRLAVSNQRRRG